MDYYTMKKKLILVLNQFGNYQLSQQPVTAKGGNLVSTPFIPDNNALINVVSKQYNIF